MMALGMSLLTCSCCCKRWPASPTNRSVQHE
jgi:hypothetical protein